MKLNNKTRLGNRGAVYAYFMVLAVVVGVGLFWIILNEVVIHVGTVMTDISGPTSNGQDIWSLFLYLWRIAPVILLIGAFLWAISRSLREERYGPVIG